MAGLTRSLRGASPRAIQVAGFAVFLIYAFPGYMSNDSVVQILEARDRQFSNPHPPIMAAEWAVLDALVSGPLLMLLVQGLLFLYGCTAVLRRAMSPRAAAICGVAVLLFPPVTTSMAVIWKDSQMAAYLIAGAPLLLAARLRSRALGLVLVTAGCAFRYNAFAAAVPLVFALFEWRPGLRWYQRYAISTVAALAVMFGASTINRVLTVVPVTLSPTNSDIVGVLAYTHERSDEELREILRDTPLHRTTNIQANARAVFSPRSAWLIGHGENRMFDPVVTDVQRAAMSRAWKLLVFGDWRAYVAYRTAVFKEMIGLSESPLWSPVFNQFVESPEQMSWIDHQASCARLQCDLATSYYWLADNTPLFRAYVYIVVALLLLVLLCRDALTFALLGSGLTYEVSYFPAAASPDFRYSHWMITCTCLSILVLFAQRWRAERSRRAGRAA
jgi:hypothetical protein